MYEGIKHEKGDENNMGKMRKMCHALRSPPMTMKEKDF